MTISRTDPFTIVCQCGQKEQTLILTFIAGNGFRSKIEDKYDAALTYSFIKLLASVDHSADGAVVCNSSMAFGK